MMLFSAKINAQSDGLQLGSNLNSLRQPSQGGFYDYSDPQSVNIKVAIWGWVKYPGKFIIPSYCTVNDLMSYAGGPTDAARLQNLRLMRMNEDSSQTIIDIKYSDLMMDIESKSLKKSPSLQPNDVLLVIGEPRYYFRDYLTMGLSIISVLVSFATLIVVYVRK
jgi:protein involved in polysaccharide export with SLBB domain